jgi:hypothetical protein
MKTNKNIFFTFLILFSLLLVSPIFAVDEPFNVEVKWIDNQINHVFIEGDSIPFNVIATNYGVDYIDVKVKLSRIDGQPITTIPLGQGFNLSSVTVYQNDKLIINNFFQDIYFSTEEFTYGGYTFDIPKGDYQLEIIGRGFVDGAYLLYVDFGYIYFSLNEYNGTETIDLNLDLDCTDELRAGDVLTCDAIVTDEYGNYIQNANVLLNDHLDCLTDSMGYCNIDFVVPSNVVPDTYYVTAVASKLNYINATALESYEVVETVLPTQALEIVNYKCTTPLYFGDNLYCELFVVDQNNNYVIDADVDFTINGINLGTVMQTANTYYVNYQVPVYLTGTGNYLIRADANKLNYDGDTEYFQIELRQHQLSLNLNCQDTVYIGEDLLCSALVTDENNDLVENSKVNFILEDNAVSCLTTSFGTCAVYLPIDNSFVENQNYTVNAQASKIFYNSANASQTFLVLPTGVEDKKMFLNIDCEDEIYLNDELVCQAKVTQELTTQTVLDKIKAFFIGTIGSPVENAKVVFDIDTTQHNQELVCMTDSAGVCQVSKDILSVYGYTQGANYAVTAIAYKLGYEEASDSDVFTIISVPLSMPTAIVNGPVNAKVNDEVIFDGSNSLPGVDAVIIKYTWSIVDSSGKVILNNWSSDVSLPYKFNDEDNYTVHLTVLNSNNLSDEATHTIVITQGSDENEEIFDSEEGIKVSYFRIAGKSDSVIEIGGDFVVQATVESYADHDLEQVRLTFYLPEYGVQFKSAGISLEKGEKKTLTLHGFLPYDMEPGIYYPMIGISDKEIRRMKVGYLEVVEK